MFLHTCSIRLIEYCREKRKPRTLGTYDTPSQMSVPKKEVASRHSAWLGLSSGLKSAFYQFSIQNGEALVLHRRTLHTRLVKREREGGREREEARVRVRVETYMPRAPTFL